MLARSTDRSRHMSGQHHHALLEAMPNPVLVISAGGVLLHANRRCATALGWERSEMIGTSVLGCLHPDDLGVTAQRLTDHGFNEGEPITIRLRGSGGTWREADLTVAAHDLTAEQQAIIVLRPGSDVAAPGTDQRDMALMRAALGTARTALAILDPGGKIRLLNDEIANQLGYPPEQVNGMAISRFLVPDDRQRVLLAISRLGPGASEQIAARFVHSDQTELAVDCTVTNMVDDVQANGYVISVRPSVAGSTLASRVAFLAEHDELTGLVNRVGFEQELEERFTAMIGSGHAVSLLVFDIDRMGQLNQLLGNSVGDRVLALVGSRLRLAVRNDDIIGRNDNDEFLLATPANAETVLMLKERLLTVISQPMNIDGHDLRVTASCAIASTAGPLSLDSLLAEAEGRLRVSKGTTATPTYSTASALADRRTVVDQLRLGVERDELRPWFQPIVDQFGTVSGYEALIRWHHPSRGVLTPAHFLPMVTLAGLDQRLEDIVMTRSLEFIGKLVDRGNDYMAVHINISPRQLSNEDFGRRLLATVQQASVPMHSVCVEITESDLLHVGAMAINNLSMIRRAGVHVAMDDFGTGYSSLSHLLELPVDCLKIDRRFVDGIGIDPTATGLSKAILSLTESMKIDCVAEGVELLSQHEQLVEFGCPKYQGWLYAPALDMDEALTFVCSEMLDYH